MKFSVYRPNDSLVAEVEADNWAEKGSYIKFYKDNGGTSMDVVLAVKTSDAARIETPPKV